MKLENFQIWNRKGQGQPRYNKVPNAFAITRFRYIEALFHIFYYFWDKENRSLYGGLRYIEVPLYMCIIYI